MKYRGHEIADCNCGGPQYGTDHAPDCQMVLDAIEVDHEIEDENWERQSLKPTRG